MFTGKAVPELVNQLFLVLCEYNDSSIKLLLRLFLNIKEFIYVDIGEFYIVFVHLKFRKVQKTKRPCFSDIFIIA